MDGIAWNEELTGPVTTVTQLLEDPKLKGKVGVWNSMGDTLGLVMLENGDDPAKVTDETFDRALAVIQKAQDAGQIRRFYGNDYAQPLANGDLAASMAWSGDILHLGDPKIKWGIAEKGGIIWTDNMLIPLGGSVPTASTYMNFVYDPKIAAQLALGAGLHLVGHGRQGRGARSSIPTRRTNTLVFPTDDMLSSSTRTTPRCSRTPTTRRSGSRCRASRASRQRHGHVLPPAPRRHAVPAARAGDAVARDLLPDPARLPRLRVAAVRSLPELRVHVGVLELLGRDPRLPRADLRSFMYAGIATVACLLLAYPLVYWIAFRAGPWRNLFLLFIVAPFFVTYLVRTLAWLNILADEGPVVGILRGLHVLGPDGRLLATTFAVVSGITYNFFPFMALPIYVSLEQMDPRLLEAAKDLYASSTQAFLRVTLPLSAPGDRGGDAAHVHPGRR